MNQILATTYEKIREKIARPDYPLSAPSKISQMLAVRQKFDRLGGMYIQHDS
jgi:hypothetical protein